MRPAGHDGCVDLSRALVLRDALSTSPLVEGTRRFGRRLTTSTKDPGGLLLVGTPTQEPWHLAAHLDEESRYAGLPVLQPTLIRYEVPPDAPAHLSVTLSRLEHARRGETVFVVAQETPPEGLLQRAWDARRTGATVLALDATGSELDDVAHESLTVEVSEEQDQPYQVTDSGLLLPTFDTVQHLVSVAAGDAASAPGRRGFKDRLARVLDAISGPGDGTPRA
jgi:hypothetical protein